MKKILINFAHPAKSRSRVNMALRSAAETLDGVTVNDLYSRYPNFMIDVEREQQLCESHDVIIFQHPFYWYSTPSIVKEWMDLVLEHGWAYGSQGHALKDKVCFQAISAGGDASTYHTNGANGFTLAELTSPFRATMSLCQMHCLPLFAITGVHRGLESEIVQRHAQDYRDVLMALQNETFDLQTASNVELINSDVTHLIKGH